MYEKTDTLLSNQELIITNFLGERKMGDLKSAKMLGGIGSLIILIGAFIPVVGLILPIIGLILVIIAVKYIADESRDQTIFKNYLLYFVLNIVATIALIAILAITVTGIAGFSYMDILSSQTGGEIDPTTLFADIDIAALLGGCIAAFVVFWILMLIATLFLKKSFTSISQHTNVSLFATTGLIYLIGAALLIIVIGVIVLLIAQIMQIIAFFSLPDKLPAATPETP
ncbi:MAG: DUF996 domain-containing protein [Thermoplasmatales archaeon]|nr:MAG: DUF996 domain-containing protein [Thermoplasmatales archaeon]